MFAVILHRDSKRKWGHMFTSFQCMNSNVDYNVEAPYVVLFKTKEPILWKLHWYLIMEFWKFALWKPGEQLPLSIGLEFVQRNVPTAYYWAINKDWEGWIPSRIVMINSIPTRLGGKKQQVKIGRMDLNFLRNIPVIPGVETWGKSRVVFYFYFLASLGFKLWRFFPTS